MVVEGNGRRWVVVESDGRREARHVHHAVDQVCHAAREAARALIEAKDRVRHRAALSKAQLDALESPVGAARLIEGEEAGEHREEADPAAPHVSGESRVPLASEDLGGAVALAAADLAQRGDDRRAALVSLVHVRQPEVAHLAVVRAVEQDVLELEVSVSHSLRVHVLHREHELLDVAARLPSGGASGGHRGAIRHSSGSHPRARAALDVWAARASGSVRQPTLVTRVKSSPLAASSM